MSDREIAEHDHEKWQMRVDPDGVPYCAACGTSTFGCVECDHTGLHYDPDSVGRSPVVSGEMHDECEEFDSDIDAARFVAYCHPMYRWLVFHVGRNDGTETPRSVAVLDLHAPLPDPVPIIVFGGAYYLCTDDVRAELERELTAELG